VPEAASTLLLPELAGRRRAARYLLLGESFGAEEGREIGLVSHVVESGGAERALSETVAALLAKPREALRLTQSLLRHGARDAIVERMQLESGHFAERLESAEVKEAISAFFEKRKPDFSKPR
jgi:enoyl-CoA hydratase/carnithine racemase